MKENTLQILQKYCDRDEKIELLKDDIVKIVMLLTDSFANGGKLLVCGNGGSNSDADHICGELLKGFMYKRPLGADIKKRLEEYGEAGACLAERLQGALPAINLGSHTSLITAVINDISGEVVFAQQVMAYGSETDIFLGISTSGNSKDVLYAGYTAKAKGMITIGLTGANGGKMATDFDYVIKVPYEVTPDIQDMHTTIYHIICAMVESEFWDE